MENTVRTTVGQPVERINTVDKEIGNVKYVGDLIGPGLLHAKLSTNTLHLNIKNNPSLS